MRQLPIPLLLFPLLFLFLLPCSEAAKKKAKPKAEDEGPAAAAAGRPTLSSGELSTKEGHSCTWEVQEARNSNVLLQVSCTAPSEKEEGEAKPSYSCQFSGKPQECPAYTEKSAPYWKQVVGKLKKRANACEGERVLKTRLCKKAPAAAHLKLVERKGEGQNDGGKKKGAGNKEGEREKEKQAKGEMKEEEPMQGDGEDAFGEMNDEPDTDPAASYCGEGWNSICRFFTKLLDG